jgi:NitT/TauT family transport system substrate-binding protein
MLQAVDAGIDIVAVAGGAAIDTSRATGGGVVARTGSNIHQPADFIGKRVGVPGLGAFMHVMFRRWLQDKGVDDSKVQFLEVPLGQTSDTLRSGNVDAVVVGEPFFSRIIHSSTGYLVADYFREMPNGTFQLYYAAERAWALAHPELLAKFRDAIAEADAYRFAQPESTRQILGKYTKLPADVVATVVLPTLRPKVTVADVNYWAGLLLDQGIIKNRPDAAKLVID